MPPITPQVQSPLPPTAPNKRKWLWLAATLVVVLLVVVGAAYASPSLLGSVVQKVVDVKDTIIPIPTLDVTPTKGALPLTVKVTYPSEWQSLIDEECSHATPVPRLGGTAFGIDWGDGRNGPPCDTHTYTAAGTFNIKAQIRSFDDVPHKDWGGFSKKHWEAGAAITVSGAGSLPSVELLSPQGGEAFLYQEFPHVTWHITTGKKLTLQIDLLDQDGKSFVAKTINDVAYDGEGSLTYLSPQSYDAYDALLREGKTRFTVRVALLDNGKVVAEQKSGDLTMSGKRGSGVAGIRVSPLSGTAPLKVSLGYSIWHPSCISYRLDWGDGSTPETLIQPVQTSCLLDSQTKTFTHTFSKAGIYTIVMKSNNSDPFVGFDSIVPYDSAIVVVK